MLYVSVATFHCYLQLVKLVNLLLRLKHKDTLLHHIILHTAN